MPAIYVKPIVVLENDCYVRKTFASYLKMTFTCFFQVTCISFRSNFKVKKHFHTSPFFRTAPDSFFQNSFF